MNLNGRFNMKDLNTLKQITHIAAKAGMVSAVLIISGCATNSDSGAVTDSPLNAAANGICHTSGSAPPVASTKADCFAKRGLFEQTDNPQASIEAAARNKKYNLSQNPIAVTRAPAPVVPSEPDIALVAPSDVAKVEDVIADVGQETTKAEAAAKEVATKKDVELESNPDEGFTIEVAEEIAEEPVKVAKTDKPAPKKDKASKKSSDKGSDPEVDCYLTGADTPFQMEKSVCLDGGGQLEKP